MRTHVTFCGGPGHVALQCLKYQTQTIYCITFGPLKGNVLPAAYSNQTFMACAGCIAHGNQVVH